MALIQIYLEVREAVMCEEEENINAVDVCWHFRCCKAFWTWNSEVLPIYSAAKQSSCVSALMILLGKWAWKGFHPYLQALQWGTWQLPYSLPDDHRKKGNAAISPLAQFWALCIGRCWKSTSRPMSCSAQPHLCIYLGMFPYQHLKYPHPNQWPGVVLLISLEEGMGLVLHKYLFFLHFTCPK